MRMEGLEVAVIIPVKNRADLLAVTLHNVLAQTLPPSELVVVDDGSTDHLSEVISRFGEKVHCVPNEGNGPGAARKLGLRLTKAPLVQFFDSDDLMTPRKMELQAKALRDASADIAYGPYVQAIEKPDGSWEQVDVIMQAHALPDADLLKWMLRGWNAITQAMLFRRTFLERCPIWDSELITHEDYLYMTRLAAHRPRIVHVAGETVLYRRHGGQSTENHTVTASRARDKQIVMNRIEEEGLATGADLLTKALWTGRLGLTADFALAQGVYCDNFAKSSKFNRVLYRLYNKFERLKTGSQWETMHGIDASPEAFSWIASQLA